MLVGICALSLVYACAFLNGRADIDFLPSQDACFFNPTLDVPFYLLATHVPAIVVGYALGFVQGLNFVHDLPTR
jgi:hypothetical protein